MDDRITASIPEMFRLVDTNGVITDCDYLYADVLGYSIDEIVGTPLLDHTPERCRDELVAFFESCKKTDRTYTVGRSILLTSIDDEIEVMQTVENLYDNERRLVGFSIVMREISHLEEMRKMYNVSARDGYEHKSVMHRSVNYTGIIIDCNQTYLDNLGYSKEDVIGVDMVLHTADRSKNNLTAHMENWRNRIRDTAKIWMLRKDGSEFPVSLVATDERNAKGELVGRTVALRPIDA